MSAPQPQVPEQERAARAAWSCLAEPGEGAAARLVDAVGHVEALRAVLDRHPGTERWWARAADLDVQRELRVLASVGGRVLVPGDEEWPQRLGDLADRPPHCLWVRGPLHAAAALERSVAVVGSRASTAYGEHVARDLAAGLADRGWTVVSGAAYGVDAAAHWGALAVGGRTAGVLACGVEEAYPRGNAGLVARIGGAGLLVSELPPGRKPSRLRFLARNRVIAALARGTVVVEAALRSGALSTANRAVELGRPVGAVPGPVTSATSAGCHLLLRDGAVCVTRAEEVLELLAGVGEDLAPQQPVERRPLDDLPPDHVAVAEALPVTAWADVASVARRAGLPPRAVAALLEELEERGAAERSGPGWRLGEGLRTR